MSTTFTSSRANLSGDIWGGFAAMLVALPSAIAFGVTIFSPLGAEFGAKGALVTTQGWAWLNWGSLVPVLTSGAGLLWLARKKASAA